MSDGSTFAASLAADLPQEDFLHVLGLVQEDTRRMLAEAQAAAAAQDVAMFRRAAHGLAGVAGQVEAAPFEHACRRAMAALAIEPDIAADLQSLADGMLREIGRILAAPRVMP